MGFSFSLTDKAKFHAQYGKFVQQTRLRDIYQGLVLVSDNIKGGYAISAPVGFGLRPERTTQYDLGFSQQLTENVAVDITGFYKDIKDQIQIRQQPNADDATHGAYYYFANGDFSTTKGFELKIDVRRTERVTASVNYTFSDAQGTGSASASGFRAIWQSPRPTAYFPQNVSPLDFNQSHRGSINIDYRFIGDDGPDWVQNSGLNLLFQYNSGHNFTKVSGFDNTRVPQESYNTSTTPWNFQLDLRVDKSFDVLGLKTNIYLLVLNILDSKNIINVQMQTGSTNNGYLETDEGKAIVAAYAAHGQQYANNYVKLYNAFNNTNGVTTVDGTGVDPYGTPRQIRLGFKIDY
ncbi:MAG: hypothetical protein HYV28_15725 [Ignavibacteriales bacterium]|nr:hypothetical protein [Ignavibacteriales bacterium]